MRPGCARRSSLSVSLTKARTSRARERGTRTGTRSSASHISANRVSRSRPDRSPLRSRSSSEIRARSRPTRMASCG
ncbi:hypothetical protein IE4872_CH03350 [Rhizobium gallicum]|uniref:Uncharacterized protein n=1 Tax=Rhizobium gallicum TaxID=56730 RepID=A0A1L5NM13_9HYPH|nr:hypothetical protein IE4872_CH03350 [Rhizobium gallicum]